MALRVLPAEITVLAGRFGAHPAAQPLVFAHLWDIAPDLDLGHVEVVPVDGGATRLAGYFDAATAAALIGSAARADTLVLVLPEAYAGLEPPALSSDRLEHLGVWRGRLRRQLGGGA